MSFFHDLNIPIVSFVGRPGDWRKGLQTFLDALEIASQLDPPVKFSTWLVGGSEAEARTLRRYVFARPHLREASERGGVVIWSRVENEALPELYSRSAIVVMPSLREQFGLVAVESMMSGTPVVALATGGLPDVIVDDLTGILVTENDGSVLANTIVGYLRNPDRRRAHGTAGAEWTRFAFDRDRAFSAFEHAYDENSSPTKLSFATTAEFRSDGLAQIKPTLQRILGGAITAVEDLTTSRHNSWRVEIGADSFFCKQYALEPSVNATVYHLPSELNPSRSFAEYAGRVRFHAENPLAPGVIAVDGPSRLIVFEWCVPAAPDHDFENAVASIANAFRRYRPAGDAASRATDAMRHFAAAPSAESLLATDVSAAELNAPTIGGVVRFQQTHPQIELWRINYMLHRGAWSLPAAVVTRMTSIVRLIADRLPFIVEQPALCHGGVKRPHVLTRGTNLVSCDFDGSRYVVGPFDEAHYVWHRMAYDDWPITTAFSVLGQLLTSVQDRALAVCWFAVDLFFFGVLRSAANGKPAANAQFLSATDAFPGLVEQLLGYDEPIVVADPFAMGT